MSQPTPRPPRPAPPATPRPAPASAQVSGPAEAGHGAAGRPGPGGPGPAGVADVTPADGAVQMSVRVRGAVQGVGFRWWTRCRALELGLTGSATNLPDGTVEVLASGPRRACAELYHLLSVQPAPPVPPSAPRSYYRRPGRVDGATVSWLPLTDAELAERTGTGFVER